MIHVTRRDFLKKTGQAVGALAGLELLAALGSGTAQEKAQKILPPETGCYWGYFRGRPQKKAYEDWMATVGVQPKFSIFPLDPGTPDWRPKEFRKDLLEYIASFNPATPIVYRVLDADIKEHGFSNLATSKEFRQDITTYAKAITEYHKPFFLCTMHELNGYWFPWGKHAGTAKKVWQTMWDIFEDNGANQYATWIWEVYTPEAGGPNTDDPDRYYPGDKYVDWIGISAYSRDQFDTGQMSFKGLTERTYSEMRRTHPDKPIMQAEFGKTKGPGQARWFKDAFQTIKNWPEMKAAIVWDVYDTGLRDDATLSEDTLKTLGEIFKDPYFIGAK